MRLFAINASEVSQLQSRRQLHVEPGAREKALLAKDSTLERFKSYRKGASPVRRIGDYLTIAVVAGMLKSKIEKESKKFKWF
uniref:Uncharacterized protein n=1 Tax=Lactuca sativa TaxID=4236 RepID=A0A9R1XXA5_LACSA|nr:hypothetical protein LSAT_V11C100001940 [Lactuca sativa]